MAKKGQKLSEELKKRLSDAHKGQIPWNKGKVGVFSEETRRKMSEANRGEKSIMFGKHLPEKTRMKISKINKGKKRSEESKKKMSEVRKGRFGGKNHPMFGKHHSEESKKKMSESQKLRLSIPGVRSKMSKARDGVMS